MSERALVEKVVESGKRYLACLDEFGPDDVRYCTEYADAFDNAMLAVFGEGWEGVDGEIQAQLIAALGHVSVVEDAVAELKHKLLGAPNVE
jgi:hypothetical protein